MLHVIFTVVMMCASFGIVVLWTTIGITVSDVRAKIACVFIAIVFLCFSNFWYIQLYDTLTLIQKGYLF